MRYLLLSLLSGFLFLGCAPSSSNKGVESGTTVDQNSYNSIVDINWCQPLQSQQNFKTSWMFAKNVNIATSTKKDLNENILSTQNFAWRLENKTLFIENLQNNTLHFKKDISFDYDLVNAKKLMKWQTPAQAPTQCQNGLCPEEPTQEVMILSECN